MSKCLDHPRMVFKGTLYYEGHSVHFDIKDDDVVIRENNGLDELITTDIVLIVQLRNKKIY